MAREVVRSGTFTLNFDLSEGGVPTPSDLLKFVVSVLGLARQDLRCVQAEFGRPCVHIKVNDKDSDHGEVPLPETCEAILAKRLRTLKCADGTERSVIITSNGRKPTPVKIHNLPPEVSDQDIGDDLLRYGRSFEIEDLLYGGDHPFRGIRTGQKIVTMELEEDIPSYIEIAGCPVIIEYPGQPRTCQLCHSPQHLRAKCPTRRGGRRRKKDVTEDPPAIVDSDAAPEPEPRRASSEPPPLLTPLFDVTPPAASKPAADASQHLTTPPADVTRPADGAPPGAASQPKQHPVSVQTTERKGGKAKRDASQSPEAEEESWNIREKGKKSKRRRKKDKKEEM